MNEFKLAEGTQLIFTELKKIAADAATDSEKRFVDEVLNLVNADVTRQKADWAKNQAAELTAIEKVDAEVKKLQQSNQQLTDLVTEIAKAVKVPTVIDSAADENTNPKAKAKKGE